MSIPISEQEKQLHIDRDHVIQPMPSPADHVTQSKVVNMQVSDDDDDDLIPFDSHLSCPPNAPRYLREAISGTFCLYVTGFENTQLPRTIISN